jgi:hypothetical protein
MCCCCFSCSCFGSRGSTAVSGGASAADWSTALRAETLHAAQTQGGCCWGAAQQGKYEVGRRYTCIIRLPSVTRLLIPTCAGFNVLHVAVIVYFQLLANCIHQTRRSPAHNDHCLPLQREVVLRVHLCAYQAELYRLVCRRLSNREEPAGLAATHAGGKGKGHTTRSGTTTMTLRGVNNTLMELRNICNHPVLRCACQLQLCYITAQHRPAQGRSAFAAAVE